jgi:hypothetical protein
MAHNQHEFSSGDGFMTTVWGPPFWFILHIISFNYPVHPTELDQEHYYAFFHSLQYVLPCRGCREHYAEHLRGLLLPDLASRHALSLWVYRLHTLVNDLLHKPTPLTFPQTQDLYEMFRAKCDATQSVCRHVAHELIRCQSIVTIVPLPTATTTPPPPPVVTISTRNSLCLTPACYTLAAQHTTPSHTP